MQMKKPMFRKRSDNHLMVILSSKVKAHFSTPSLKEYHLFKHYKERRDCYKDSFEEKVILFGKIGVQNGVSILKGKKILQIFQKEELREHELYQNRNMFSFCSLQNPSKIGDILKIGTTPNYIQNNSK